MDRRPAMPTGHTRIISHKNHSSYLALPLTPLGNSLPTVLYAPFFAIMVRIR
jgi:hypothetical protein